MFLCQKKLGGIDHLLVYHVDESSKKCHFSPKIGTLQKFLRSKIGVAGVAEKNSARTKNIQKFFQKKFHGADVIFRCCSCIKAPETVF